MRIDKVHKRLQELSSAGGASAGELADDLGLARANVSGDLNRLCAEGRAAKAGTHPVLYRAIEGPRMKAAEKPDAFSIFTAASQSLAGAVESVKAAVLYPPRGMSMLITGETGVGKSAFAERVHRYAVDTGTLAADAPFVVFNCADYASNPNLLVSQLFGTRKGAFTGADADKPGLLEKADGGILFLDEVHRLPPEGQEMLFTFMDRGKFRRLGDDVERSALVRLVAATTESPESVLLRTFTRRFPMKVELPPLRDRDFDERLALLAAFFNDEALRLGKPVEVSLNSLRSLLSYECPGNIGQLKTDVQLLCARSYSDYLAKRRSSIQVVSADLPARVRGGLLDGTKHRQLWKRLGSVDQRFCSFSGDSGPSLFEDGTRDADIYRIIEKRVGELQRLGVDQAEVGRHLEDEIDGYFSRYYAALSKTAYARIGALAGERMEKVAKRLDELVQVRLGRRLDRAVANAMTIHVLNAVESFREGRRAVKADFDGVRTRHPAEFHAAAEGLKIIEQELGVPLPLDEAGFLAMFFVIPSASGRREERVRVIVLAHGDSTASSMAGTCNKLLGTNYAVGLDAPLSESPGAFYGKVEAFLRDNDPGQDALLLVDMGSLNNFGVDLEKALGVSVRTIPMVSTLHVLQATRKAMLGLPLAEVYRETLEVTAPRPRQGNADSEVSPIRSLPDAPIPVRRLERTRLIAAICASGTGNAPLLKAHLEETLDLRGSGVQVVALALVDGSGGAEEAEEAKTLEREGRLLFAVTPFALDLRIPRFSPEEAFSDRGLQAMQELLDQEAIFAKVADAYADKLSGVDSRSVFAAVRDFIAAVERGLGRTLNEGVLVGVASHLACALDRAARGISPRPFPGRERFVQAHREALEAVRGAAPILGLETGAALSEDEYCYVAAFFDPANCA